MLASHNSYHLLAPVPLTGPIGLTLEYSHAPLDQQLETQGVRSFELDTVNPPGDEFPVVHEPNIDAASNCTPITHCLDVIAEWSKAHPRHVPIVVLIEPKDGALELQLDPQLAAFDAARGRHPRRPGPGRAREAAHHPGRGAREGEDAAGRRHREGMAHARQGAGPGARGSERPRRGPPSPPRRPSVAAGPGDVRDRRTDGAGGGGRPRGHARRGEDPRSRRGRVHRADARRRRSRRGPERRHDETRGGTASGAQIVSTDFPVPNPPVGGDYVVQIPDGTPARCNPVIAPASCRSEDVEDPEQLTARVR